MMRVIGVLFHRRGELLHAGRRLFQSGCLLFGTGRKIVVAHRDFTRAGIDGIRPSRTLATVSISERCIWSTLVASSVISLRPETVSVFVRSPRQYHGYGQ